MVMVYPILKGLVIISTMPAAKLETLPWSARPAVKETAPSAAMKGASRFLYKSLILRRKPLMCETG